MFIAGLAYEFVDRLARRIITLAPGVVSGAVETVDAALSSQEDELRVEEEVFFRLFVRSAAVELTRAACSRNSVPRR